MVKELKNIYPHLEVEGIVGPNLVALGAKQTYSMSHLSIMGFVEPLLNLPKLMYIRYKVYKRILEYKPDLFIGVDAPEFNLGLEKKLKKSNITTVHYVSPSVWAWRPGRIKLIKQAVDLMLTLFPFELNFYKRHDVNAVYVGHYLADQVPMDLSSKDSKKKFGFAEHDKVLTIMPGSRKSELRYLGKIYLQVAKEIFLRFPFIKFILPVTCQEHEYYIKKLINKIANNLPIKIVLENSHDAINAANFVLVTSGTATLEVMLYKKPMIVAYKTNLFTYQLAKRLVTVKYISLPNLLADSFIVQEFIQEKVTAYNLTRALSELITANGITSKQVEIFNNIHKQLQKNANYTAAQAIANLLSCNKNVSTII